MASQIIRRTIATLAALFCGFAVYACGLAATEILHIPGAGLFGFEGWQVVQAGVAFMGASYAGLTLFALAQVVRK